MTHLAKRKREKGEDKERVEDAVGPKEVGREGMLEKKRMARESNKAFREAKEDGGLEVSENVLMGGGGSFKERYVLRAESIKGSADFALSLHRIAQRDAARARFEAKKRESRGSRVNERIERTEQIKEKDRKTMEMFKQMAKERFG